MTIAAYQTLYESSVAFGMRKALQAEQGKFDMEKKVGTFYLLLEIINNGCMIYITDRNLQCHTLLGRNTILNINTNGNLAEKYAGNSASEGLEPQISSSQAG